MAVTDFKTAIPYNSIRLSRDVANWISGEYTEADTSTETRLDMHVSMANLQRASSATPSVIQGNVPGGLAMWNSSRYAVAAIGDESAANGVFDGAVDNTDPANPWVNARDHDLSANPTAISLGELAGVDYTGVHPGSSLDYLDFLNNGSTRPVLGFGNVEACVHFPFFVTSYSDDGVKKLVAYRASPSGDRFSSYASSNYSEMTMNNSLTVPVVVPFTSSSIDDNFNNRKAGWVASFGRLSTNSSFIVGQANAIDFSSGGVVTTNTWSIEIQGAQGNLNTGQSNALVSSACYVEENRVAVLKGRGGGQYRLYLSNFVGSGIGYGSGVNMGTSVSYGGIAAQVVCTVDAYSTPYLFTAHGTNRSSYNSEVRMCRWTRSSNTLSKSQEATIVTASNSIKSARLAILATESNAVWFIVMHSNTSGDLEFRLVKHTLSTNGYSVEATYTYQSNDTGIDNRISVTALTKVKKSALSYSGGAFQPGQTNNFKNTVYFMATASSNTESGNGILIYGKANLTDSSISIVNNRSMESGTHPIVATNQFGDSSRKLFLANDAFSQGSISGNVRGNAGPYWWPIIYNSYRSSSSKTASVTVGGLDKYFNWSGLRTGEPGGGVVFDSNDLPYQDASNFVPPETTGPVWTGGGVYSGEWNVWFGASDQFHAYGPGYGVTQTSAPDYFTTGVATVADATEFLLVLHRTDADGNDWRSFFDTYVIPSINSNGYLDIEVETTNKDSNRFRIIVGSTGLAQFSPFFTGLLVNTGTNGGISSYTGDEWTFSQPLSGADVHMLVKFYL